MSYTKLFKIYNKKQKGLFMNSYEVKNLKDFNLEHIFECGQCFRWDKISDDKFHGVAFGKSVTMETFQEGDDSVSLIITPCTREEFETIWYDYLDLGRDYGKIKAKLSANDEILVKATEYGYGIRILNQDLWETIISFIISQNNNIPRIKGCIEKFCELFGEKLPDGKYSFPKVQDIAKLTVEDLAEVRLGYRAKYIVATAKCISENGLPRNEEELLNLIGIGPKVANCITLFGMAKYHSFPIDVWVKRVMNELYGIPVSDVKAMKKYAEENFGELGGFAQQYLFHYMRHMKF